MRLGAAPNDEERDQPQVPIRAWKARSSSSVSFALHMKTRKQSAVFLFAATAVALVLSSRKGLRMKSPRTLVVCASVMIITVLTALAVETNTYNKNSVPRHLKHGSNNDDETIRPLTLLDTNSHVLCCFGNHV